MRAAPSLQREGDIFGREAARIGAQPFRRSNSRTGRTCGARVVAGSEGSLGARRHLNVCGAGFTAPTSITLRRSRSCAYRRLPAAECLGPVRVQSQSKYRGRPLGSPPPARSFHPSPSLRESPEPIPRWRRPLRLRRWPYRCSSQTRLSEDGIRQWLRDVPAHSMHGQRHRGAKRMNVHVVTSAATARVPPISVRFQRSDKFTRFHRAMCVSAGIVFTTSPFATIVPSGKVWRVFACRIRLRVSDNVVA